MRGSAPLLFVVLAACGGGFRDREPLAPKPSCGAGGTLAVLTRGGCLRTCPIYRLTVCRDGTVVYDGSRFVKEKGRHVRRLTAPELQAIAAVLQTAPEGEDPLTVPTIRDVPTVFVRYEVNGDARFVALAGPGTEG